MINRPIYVDKIMAYADTPFVKILTGARRLLATASTATTYRRLHSDL